MVIPLGRLSLERQLQASPSFEFWSRTLRGFEPASPEGGGLNYIFDSATFDRMKAQPQRADEKRRRASKSTIAPLLVTSSDSQPEIPKKESLGRSTLAMRRPVGAGPGVCCPLAQHFGGGALPQSMHFSVEPHVGDHGGRKLSDQSRDSSGNPGDLIPSAKCPATRPVAELLAA